MGEDTVIPDDERHPDDRTDSPRSPVQTDGGPAPSAVDEAGYDVPDPQTQEFGLRGWGLVLALIVAFILIPWTIISLPAAQDQLETLPLGWRDAYLVLPFIPAVGLGALGVWTAVANRRE